MDGRHHLVVGSSHDPDRCLDAWQQFGELGKVFAVALGVRDGVGEAIAFVARHVVFADLIRRGVAGDRAQGDLDDLAPADPAIGREVGRFDPLLEDAGDIHGTAAPPLPTTMLRNYLVGGGEQD